MQNQAIVQIIHENYARNEDCVMLTSERQQQILSILQLRRRSNVTELSKLLYTSPSTIRRILVEMENLRLVKRKYGEVEICESNAFVIPQNLRLNKDALLKKRLAKKAASLVKDGSVIFFGSFFHLYSPSL